MWHEYKLKLKEYQRRYDIKMYLVRQTLIKEQEAAAASPHKWIKLSDSGSSNTTTPRNAKVHLELHKLV